MERSTTLELLRRLRRQAERAARPGRADALDHVADIRAARGRPSRKPLDLFAEPGLVLGEIYEQAGCHPKVRNPNDEPVQSAGSSQMARRDVDASITRAAAIIRSASRRDVG